MALDVAVGTWAWVQTKGKQRDPAAETRAPPLHERNRLDEPIPIILQDNSTCPRNAKTVLFTNIKHIYVGVICPDLM